ncbi:MAG: U32 family peptidase [Absicoccus sp.]|uniref:peptidase U32 family protein n=1 Tax=Absicoccus sp. TaxID=2718527 RepID=UPI002A74D8A3|nr:U32 family peptidase [Absicoccus sp.]MDY3036101.1 U32 family peptidase [Absicoccus sp.]
MEILAPVGDRSMLDAALAGGCDAVYLALKHFGARAYAKNFTLEEVKDIIQRCHLIGVDVHVTMNTILYEEEVEAAYAQAKALYEMGVDALIVQDLGLIHLLHHRLPELTIHASTQMSIHTPAQIEQLKKLGVKRVVLARECTKAEIEACQQSGVEIEVFVHGALCISVSGQCYFSSFCYGRSGNRGICAQPCRMAYTLYKDGQPISFNQEYLLSPKDVSVIDQIGQLSVDSLKIEGRMKSPVYVYEACRQVKMVRDGKKRTEKDKERLKLAFNRGYTLGHMFDQRGYNLMHMDSPNHQGIPIGKVIGIHGKRVKIQLDRSIDQNDGIRFGQAYGCRVNYLFDEKGRLQKHIDGHHRCEVEVKSKIQKGSIVYKTISYALEKEVEKASKETIRKVKVSCFVHCDGPSTPLVCTMSDGIHTVTCVSEQLASVAQKHALNQDTIAKQMYKTKDSWVEITAFACTLVGDIFFPMGVINALRRTTIEALEKERTKICCQPEKPYAFQPKVTSDHRIYVQDLPDSMADLTKNVTNSYGIAACLEMGFEKVALSIEMTPDQIQKTVLAFGARYHVDAPVVVYIYGKIRYMIMKHCPINTVCLDGKRQDCHLCHRHHFELEGKDGCRLLMKGNKDCYMQLFDETPRNWLAMIPAFQALNINDFYVHFVDESPTKKEEIIALIHSVLR